MSDYRIAVKVQNNNILSLIEAKGFKSALDFCNKTDYVYGSLTKLINMKEIPLRKDGKIRDSVYRLCDVLNCVPEQLFSATQMETALEQNRAHLNVSEAEAMFMLECRQEPKMLEEMVLESERKEALLKALEYLTPREQKVITMRFGLDGRGEYTLEEVGRQFEVTRDRIRQIEAKALRKLRHPCRWEAKTEDLFEGSVDDRA